MARIYPPNQATESITPQEPAAVSKATTDLKNDQQSIWPDKKLLTMTLGVLESHSRTPAAIIRRNAAIAKARVISAPRKTTTTLPKTSRSLCKVPFILHKSDSSSFNSVSFGGKTTHTSFKSASNASTLQKPNYTLIKQPKGASADIEGLSTVATSTNDSTSSTEDLASLTSNASAITEHSAPATRDAWTMTEELSTKTTDATAMTEGAATEAEVVSSHVECATATGSKKDDRPPVRMNVASSVNLPSSIQVQSGSDSSNPICIDISDDTSPVGFAPATPAPVVSVTSRVNKKFSRSDLPIQSSTVNANKVSPRVGTPSTTSATIAKTLDSGVWYTARVDHHKHMVAHKRVIQYSYISTNSGKETTDGTDGKVTGSAKRKREQDVDVDDKSPLATTNRRKRQRLLAAVGSGLLVLGALGFSATVTLSAPVGGWFSIMAQQDQFAFPSFHHYLQPPAARLLDWPRFGTGFTLA
ncbi:hypothetical protein BG000_008826 [Podila horticola]|nr:hypothetical protein BG000_008826 [Podila horticola]